MKKIISLMLVISLMLGLSSVLSGCKKKISSGTEAAKLLLANERLDENLVAQKIDIGLDSLALGTASTEKRPSPLSFLATPLASSNAAYSWSDFPATNDTASQFSAFIMNIEHQAKYVAEDIANMKNNVGVVDKWVKVGSEKQLLRVYDNMDVLIVDDMYDNVHVYYRYTDQNANNVYEMYSFMKYDDGTTGEIKTMYIPGSRYEYSYINSNGFEDYVILENSRGYWVGNRFDFRKNEYEESSSYTPIVIKDNFCYSAYINISSTGISIIDYSVVDLLSGNELVTLNITNDLASYILNASGIKSGLVSLGAENVYFDGDIYQTAELTELVTTNGSHGWVNSEAGEIGGFSGGQIAYDYGRNIYRGYILMTASLENGTLEEAFVELDKILDRYDLTLYKSTDKIYEQMQHAYALGNDFSNVFEWNGYKLDSLTNVRSARNVLKSSFNDARAKYEEVKNNETAKGKQKLDPNATFAPLSIISTSQNSYQNGSVTIPSVTAQITDTALLENGGGYVLKVALSLCDASGNPISVNTVALAGTPSQSITFDGSSITLSASGSYTVPKNLIAGDYALVVYAATADDEIRVSEMVKIGSFSTYNEKLDSTAMDISVMNVGDTLHFKYAIKNSYTVQIASSGRTYTHLEIERLITVEILKKGAPFVGAVLEYADGGAVGEAKNLGVGTYRMMCYLNTSDGLAQSYIYLVIS